MTTGQKIIGSVLVVASGLLMLNLSLDVGGQDVWHEETFALDEIRQAIKDASWAASRDVQAMIEATEAARMAAYFDRISQQSRREREALMYQSPPVSSGNRSSSGYGTLAGQVADINWKLDKLREAIEAERLQAATQRDWVRKRLVRLRQIIEPKFGLPPSAYAPRGPGVVGERPGHPDFVVDDDANERGLRKFFDELRAREKTEPRDEREP